MHDNAKVFIAAAMAALWAYAQQLIIPLVLLIIVMVVDYISGVLAAWKAGELSSRVGIMGIVKKLSYLALVIVGCVMDYLIGMISGHFVGAEVSFRAIGLVVICWLIINECISILENVAKQGGPVPPFLAPLLKHLKSTTEAQSSEAFNQTEEEPDPEALLDILPEIEEEDPPEAEEMPQPIDGSWTLEVTVDGDDVTAVQFVDPDGNPAPDEDSYAGK